KHGYQQRGADCVAVAVPQNAQLDYTGHTWSCKHGYQQRGADCVTVAVPQNAQLDYTGHAWTCVPGFTRSREGCISTGSRNQAPARATRFPNPLPRMLSRGASGHEAGYAWAEEHGIDDPDDCGGNSDSFIEGCQEYAEEQQEADSAGK